MRRGDVINQTTHLEFDFNDIVGRGDGETRPQPSLQSSKINKTERASMRCEGTICDGRARVRRICLFVF